MFVVSLTQSRYDAARWRPQDFAALMVSRGIPLPAECDDESHSRLNLMLEKHAGAAPVSKGAQDTHCTIRVNKPVTLKVVRWELNTCRADALWERDGQKDQVRVRTPHSSCGQAWGENSSVVALSALVRVGGT